MSSMLCIDINDEDIIDIDQVTNHLDELLKSALAETTIDIKLQKERPSCYKVPHYMRSANPEIFDPDVVAFGPYHHGRFGRKMANHKLRTFNEFKKRYNLTTKLIVDCVSDVIEDLLEFYDKLNENYNFRSSWKVRLNDNNDAQSSFLLVMVVDGCFMLEILLNNDRQPLSNDIEDVKLDMLMLENQLPMVLLDRLHLFANQKFPSSSTSSHIIPNENLKSLICTFMNIPKEIEARRYLHILDMYREKLLLSPTKISKENIFINPYNKWNLLNNNNSSSTQLLKYEQTRPIIPTATRLQHAGIRFETSLSLSLEDVSFDENRGVFKIPHVDIDNHMIPTLLNVMAFEKVMKSKVGNEVTSFVILMDSLIKVEKDATVLTSQNILTTSSGINDDHVALFFNVLGRGVSRDSPTHFNNLYRLVNKYYSNPWHKWSASLIHNNFKSPWTIISLGAASLGFVLLSLQAFYQVFGYYHPIAPSP